MPLSDAEKLFAMRMMPHIEKGLSPEDAARAVLVDDGRLADAALDSDAHLAIHTSTGAFSCTSRGGRTGDLIRTALAQTVYRRLRAA